MFWKNWNRFSFLYYCFQNTTTNNRRIDLTSLPRLDEVHTSQIDQLLHLKLLGCCENISFQIDSKDIKHKRSTKRNPLLQTETHEKVLNVCATRDGQIKLSRATIDVRLFCGMFVILLH